MLPTGSRSNSPPSKPPPPHSNHPNQDFFLCNCVCVHVASLAGKVAQRREVEDVCEVSQPGKVINRFKMKWKVKKNSNASGDQKNKKQLLPPPTPLCPVPPSPLPFLPTCEKYFGPLMRREMWKVVVQQPAGGAVSNASLEVACVHVVIGYES